MRVLLITYYFPPAGGGGVQRVLSWCRHLPASDIDVTVAAPQEPQWIDVDTTLVIPPTTTVIRTTDPSPPAVIPRSALGDARGLTKLTRWLSLQPRRFAVPDIHRKWHKPALAQILQAAHAMRVNGEAPWDVVISSSPPETTHVIAYDVAQALGIPWVADFRDSWLDLPHLRLEHASVRMKHERNRRLASRIMAGASAAVTVSEPLARDLRVRHPQLDVHVVENGVELADVQRAQQRASGFVEDDRFVVAYTGNFFGRQSPTSLLDAIELLLSGSHAADLRDELCVRFIGGMKHADRSRIESSDTLQAVVEVLKPLRHDDVLAQQAAADLLYLYVAPGSGSEGVYTGKVFEYVASGTPMLAAVPQDNVAAVLARDAGLTREPLGGIVQPDDASDIAQVILGAWQAWRTRSRVREGLQVSHDVLSRIDRRTGSERLAEIVRRVAAH